jgi:phage terminase large subunit-like protein
MKQGPWVDDLRTEILAFPHGLHNDQVDSISQALNWISPPRMQLHPRSPAGTTVAPRV